ncbi:MAG: nucleoside-diphosphate kinase [Dehalococcoidales bacterium]|nr:nucleoside-diphosphate kinase [Dehalococcoidales bacterium]
MERSLILVKPDAMKKNAGGRILASFESKGLKIVGLKILQVDEALARKHYEMHVEKSFFGELLEFITSSPIIAAVLEGEGAVNNIRKIMGTTDPAKADEGTIRKEFGTDIQQNAVHGSDSLESAEREIGLFFKKEELFDY